jgi:hypothetical protein
MTEQGGASVLGGSHLITSNYEGVHDTSHIGRIGTEGNFLDLSASEMLVSKIYSAFNKRS